MKIFAVICTVAGTLSLACVMAHAESGKTDLKPTGASQLPADEAVKLALEYTGFGELDGFSEEQISEPMLISADHGTRSPIAVDQIKGRTVWEVVFANVLLNLPNSGQRSIQKEAKDITVLIDATTGRLLKIYFEYDATKHGFTSDPWARFLEGRKRPYRDNELTRQSPPSTLCDALRLRLRFDPFLVKEFEAYCIEFHWPEPEKRLVTLPRESVPVWLIVTRDFGLIPSSGEPETPNIQGEYIEYLLIDVSTDEPRLVIRNEPAKPRH